MEIAVIGYGYWGPNLVRNFSHTDGVTVKVVCDFNSKRELALRKTHTHVEFATDWNEVVHRRDIDAVAIATPVSSHYEIAKKALLNGKHVFIEKPITSKSCEAEELIELAGKLNLKIMVDHTFLFTGAVQKIEKIISNNELGDIYYFDSTRVNLGLFQHDSNVIWDLAAHDFSILTYLIKDPIRAVTACGMSHVSDFEDVAYIIVHFDRKIIAHLSVNWLSPVKIRSILIGGNKKMLVWNDILPDEKIKIYNKGVDIENGEGRRKLLISYRSGDIHVPKVDPTEALQQEAKYFSDCVTENKTPFNDGLAGLEVVKILEACDESVKLHGRTIEL